MRTGSVNGFPVFGLNRHPVPGTVRADALSMNFSFSNAAMRLQPRPSSARPRQAATCVPRWSQFIGILGSLAVALVGHPSARAGAPDLRSLERADIGGQPYLRLSSWAALLGARLAWRPGEKELRVTNSSHRLDFILPSRRATVEGIEVWLSYPVQLWRDSPYIAETDLRWTLHPLLFPPRHPGGKRPALVALDPGHGGKDPGYESPPRKEKQYTLLLALEMKCLLAKAGLRVILTRHTDRFVDLEERVALARRAGADLFVSLHFNSAPGARGSEVYCLPPPGAPGNGGSRSISAQPWPGNRFDAHSLLLAYRIQAALVRRFGMADRGVRRERFVVLREARMPAVLVEGAFLSDPSDARRIVDMAERRRMAQTIVDGILSYRKVAAPSPAPRPRTPRASGQRAATVEDAGTDAG
jgi:N-acetylmuramoyl-L-alanine amidase